MCVVATNSLPVAFGDRTPSLREGESVVFLLTQ